MLFIRKPYNLATSAVEHTSSDDPQEVETVKVELPDSIDYLSDFDDKPEKILKDEGI